MIELKTLRYLDVLEVLAEVEKESKRVGLKEHIWRYLCEGHICNGSMIYINIEDDYEDLIEHYGEYLGNDLEAIKQAVAHIPLEDIFWFVTW